MRTWSANSTVISQTALMWKLTWLYTDGKRLITLGSSWVKHKYPYISWYWTWPSISVGWAYQQILNNKMIWFYDGIKSWWHYHQICWTTYHARWEKWLSVEHPTTSQLILRNSSTRSLNAIISVGQTNVLKVYQCHLNHLKTMLQNFTGI